MKVSKTKVRLKDLRAGITIYVASPMHGIEKYLVLSTPYKVDLGYSITKSYSMFFRSRKYYSDWVYDSTTSARDAGIVANNYNDRKTFFKLKHAEEWVSRGK